MSDDVKKREELRTPEEMLRQMLGVATVWNEQSRESVLDNFEKANLDLYRVYDERALFNTNTIALTQDLAGFILNECYNRILVRMTIPPWCDLDPITRVRAAYGDHRVRAHRKLMEKRVEDGVLQSLLFHEEMIKQANASLKKQQEALQKQVDQACAICLKFQECEKRLTSLTEGSEGPEKTGE